MKKILFTLIEVLLIISMLSGCILVPTPGPGVEPGPTPDVDPTPNPGPTPDPEDPPLNNLTGTFDRPYASYYEEGKALLGEDSYVVYFNFDGFARYYFDAYLADENLSKDSTLKKLMGEGTFFENFKNALPSITNPCQNQILSGATSAVTKNVYRYYSKSLNMVIQQERENSSKILPQVTVENGISTASVAHYLAEPYLNFSDTNKLYITTDSTDPAIRGTALEGSYLDRFNQLIKLVKGEPLKTSGKTVTVSELPRFIVFYADDLDAIGHNESDHYGVTRAETEEERMQNVLARLKLMDDKLGEFIEACKEKGIYDKMTFFLTTDHGMAPFGTQSANDAENYELSKFGDLCTDIKKFNNTFNVEMVAPNQSPSKTTNVVAVGANLNVQLTFIDGITDSQLQTLKTYLMTKKYIGNVLTRTELAEMGYWTEAADIIVTPAENYCFSGQLFAKYIARGQHDSTLPSANNVFGIAWGNGIKAGYVYEDVAYNYDFGVTMAACLGVTLPDANGIVLDIFER